jgi:predicted MFS family arabinose efflux permease
VTGQDDRSATATGRAIALAVLAAALGFFVDAYDLILYSIVRTQSLTGLGVAAEEQLGVGVTLLNAQLVGMLLGGVAWGVWGDRFGRRSVLFGSIFLYSAATLANAWVGSLAQYGVCRFLAGLGLAGELGAGITLVSELMPPRGRGYGTMIVAAVGVLGVVTASLVGDRFSWRTAYVIGGTLGFLLLLFRIGVSESGLYQRARARPVSRGNFLALFTNRNRARRYLCVIAVALPIWYAIGILVTFSPELGRALGLAEAPRASRAVLFYYLALTIGDLSSGLLSQRLRTRKRIIGAFLVLLAGFGAAYFLLGGRSVRAFYGLCALLGWASGYWAVFLTTAAELFGTNIRATVAVTAPNFVRGLMTPVTLLFKDLAPRFGALPTAATLGLLVLVCAALALAQLDETYGRDLDYLEPMD